MVIAAPEFSSLPISRDEFQIVQAGRARRQKAAEEQILRDEQLLLDVQLAGEVVDVSSRESSGVWNFKTLKQL